VVLRVLTAEGVESLFDLALLSTAQVDGLVAALGEAQAYSAPIAKVRWLLQDAVYKASLVAFDHSLPPPPPPPLAPPRPVPDSTACGRWSRGVPDRQPGRFWTEELAAGRKNLSAHHVHNMLYEVFEEERILSVENRRVGPDSDCKYFSFEMRCVQSGAEVAQDRSLLDESGLARGARPNQAPRWEGGPMKRLRLACAPREGLPSQRLHLAVRPLALLVAEASFRNHCHSCANSWRSYASGIRAWGAVHGQLLSR
jgi:hypothetical protein